MSISHVNQKLAFRYCNRLRLKTRRWFKKGRSWKCSQEAVNDIRIICYVSSANYVVNLCGRVYDPTVVVILSACMPSSPEYVFLVISCGCLSIYFGVDSSNFSLNLHREALLMIVAARNTETLCVKKWAGRTGTHFDTCNGKTTETPCSTPSSVELQQLIEANKENIYSSGQQFENL